MDTPNIVVTGIGALVGIALIVRLGIHWWFREKREQLRSMLNLEVKEEEENHK
jgi:hypothetical protein